MEQTQIVTRAREIDLVTTDRVHCLELSLGEDVEKRHVVSPLGLKIGRTAPAEIVLADSEISRSHCMVVLKGDDVLVSDLGSTNGTFIDGEGVSGVNVLPVGSVLQVGNRTFKHEWRTRAEIEQSDDFDRELHRAANYVKALLPPPARSVAIPRRTRNVVIGAMPAMEFHHASIKVPHGASFSLFSDGVFEICDKDGPQAWSAIPGDENGGLADQGRHLT